MGRVTTSSLPQATSRWLKRRVLADELARIKRLIKTCIIEAETGVFRMRISPSALDREIPPTSRVVILLNAVQLTGSPMPFDVLLVEDHKIMRDGIKAILSRSGEFRVVGEAETGTDAVQFVKRLHPAMVLMDIGLPGLNGVETTAEILRHHPECKVVILSMYDDENSVVSAIRSGARAFILKKASDSDLLEALRVVAQGGAYLSPQVSDRLLTRIQKGDLESRQAPSALESLSPRELQVLRLVAEGKTSKEIAVMLDLREHTVRSYRKAMMKKLGVNNVAGLTQLALSCGLTQLSRGQAATEIP